MAYTAACHAHKFPDAKALYNKMGGDKDKYKQTCMREGFDPSAP
jgi:hypothetical protein